MYPKYNNNECRTCEGKNKVVDVMETNVQAMEDNRENLRSKSNECKCDMGGLMTMENEHKCDFEFSQYSMAWPCNPELANAYVPFQTINKLYAPIDGLKQGTIFPELVM